MENKYTKKEILASLKYEKWREWLKVNLPDDNTYTLAEVEDFMTPLFEETNAGVKNTDGSLTLQVESDATEANVLTLGINGKTPATIRANENGALFHSGHLGVWSLDAGGSLTKDGKEVVTENDVCVTDNGNMVMTSRIADATWRFIVVAGGSELSEALGTTLGETKTTTSYLMFTGEHKGGAFSPIRKFAKIDDLFTESFADSIDDLL